MKVSRYQIQRSRPSLSTCVLVRDSLEYFDIRAKAPARRTPGTGGDGRGAPSPDDLPPPADDGRGPDEDGEGGGDE
eukprot:3754641-Pyramimonas_sp.AAC.1